MATDDRSLLYAILLVIGVGIIFPIVAYFAFTHGSASEKEYVEKGVLTDCYVETVITVNRRQQVTVVYKNAAGASVRARGILNKKVSAGETVQAYVLADKPGEVYFPANPIWKWLCLGVFGLLVLTAWIPLIAILHARKNERLAEQMRLMNSRYRGQ